MSEKRFFSNKYKLLFILIILVCLFTTQSVMAADYDTAQNLTLDDNSDSISFDSSNGISWNDKLGTADDEVLSSGEYSLYDLYASVYWTDEGEQLTLTHDYKYNPSTDNEWCPMGVYVFKSITINGNGHYIDGADASNLMYIYGNDVVLRNITFINGNYNGLYAPIHVFSDNVQFIDCTFINNVGSYGGAIDWYDGQNGALTNCRFENNTADKSGGAIAIESYKVDINNCDFINNDAIYCGGAVYIGNRVTDQVITDSTFSRNRVENYGGAVYVGGDGCTIQNTAFSDNSAKMGGAIYWNGDDGLLIQSWDIYENEATYGGAVYWNGANGEIYDSRIHHNHAAYGGGLYLNVLNNIIWSHFDVNDADFGGGIYVGYNADGTEIVHTNFGQNWARNSGGAIYWSGPNGTVDSSTFYNNGVQGSNVRTSGGAIYWIGDHAQIKDSKFIMNNAYSYGESSEGGALTIVNNYATVENTLFEENSADSCAGAIKWNGNYLTVDNSTFNKNYVSVSGGAIDGSGNNFVINQSTFTENQALAYMGGALSLDASGIIDNSKFIENFAYKGGAIHWLYGNYLINNSYFYKNHAVYGGGAIASDYYYFTADKSIQNSIFEENYCVNYGGAVTTLNTDIVGSTFKDNMANMGGAIYSYSSKISDVTLINNDAIVKTTELIEINYSDDIIGNSTRKTNTSYIAMCVERNTMFPHLGIKDDSLSGLVNVKTGESIADYLKILVYTYFNSTDDVYPHEGDHILFYPEGYRDYEYRWDYAVEIPRPDYYSRAVHEFSDHDFWNSDHPVVKKVLELYETVYANGTNMPDKFIKEVNGSLIEYEFSSMISSTSQSLFLFNMIKHNMSVQKIALDKTVYLGNQTSFMIVVTNNGESELTDIEVKETEHDGLKLVDFTADDSWTGNVTTGKFIYTGTLKPGENASFIAIFDTIKSGNLTNVVVASSNKTENKKANNTTEVVPVRVNVTKVWEDDNNRDNLRTDNVTIYLLADDEIVSEIVLSEENGWNYIFNDLPMVKDGKVINYTVSENPISDYTMNVIDNTADDFTVVVANNTYVFTVKNTHVPAVTDVNVVKVWDDNGNQDGVRPAGVTVQLLADGVVVDSAVLDASNEWSFTFTDLAVYKHNGTEIVYTVNETAVPGYVADFASGDGNWIISNVHVPAVTDVSVVKVWDDNGNQDGVRPVGVTVVLFADGVKVDEAVLDADNDWSAVFTDLPVYDAGNVIVYSVDEVGVADYASVVFNDTAYSFTVNNVHVPAVNDVSVVKVWNDGDDKYGIRPASIKVILVADADIIADDTLSADNYWSTSFSNLPVYNNGKSIEYSIVEVEVEGYAVEILNNNDGSFFIINSYVPVYVPNVSVEISSNNKTDEDEIIIVVNETDNPNVQAVNENPDNLAIPIVYEHISSYDDLTVDNITKFDYKPLTVEEPDNSTVVNETTPVDINNETVVNNITNQTVNIDNTTNVTDNPVNDSNTNKTVTPSPEPSVPEKQHVPKHIKPDSHATGNPILLLLLTLLVPLIRRKRK